jgi:hypothetical protein
MMRLSVSYTKAIYFANDWVGPLFQGSFQAKNVDTDAYLGHLIGYIHLNPVQSGLVQSPDEWDFSSFSTFQDHQQIDPIQLYRPGDLGGLKDHVFGL